MKLRFLMGSLALVALVGCGDAKSTNDNERAFYHGYYNPDLDYGMYIDIPLLKGDVQSVVLTISNAAEKFGEIVVEDELFRGEYEFTPAGHVRSHKEYHYSELHRVRKMEYNNSDKCTKVVEYNGDGELVKNVDVLSSEKGHVLSENHYNGEGELIYRLATECDKEGNPITVTNYGADGEIVSLVRQQFNTKGKLTKYLSYDSEGQLKYEMSYEYNSDGNVISEQHNHIYNDEEHIAKYTNNYDSKGRLTERLCEGDNYTARTIHTYNEEGNLVEQVHSTSWGDDEEEKVNELRIYEYDSKGNVTRYVVYESGHKGRKEVDKVYDFEIEYR